MTACLCPFPNCFTPLVYSLRVQIEKYSRCEATIEEQLTLMCYENYFGHISKTQDNTSCYEENKLHLSQPQQSHEDVKREGELDV